MDKSNQDSKLIVEAKKQFNEFQAQARSRMDNLLKLVLVVSGGMLTLSVGAVLGKPELNIPAELIPALKYGWLLLFYSIAASLFLMFTALIATYHMGVRWFAKLDKLQDSTDKIMTWQWLRIFNLILGISILLSCVGGIGVMAYVANGVVSAPLSV